MTKERVTVSLRVRSTALRDRLRGSQVKSKTPGHAGQAGAPFACYRRSSPSSTDPLSDDKGRTSDCGEAAHFAVFQGEMLASPGHGIPREAPYPDTQGHYIARRQQPQITQHLAI